MNERERQQRLVTMKVANDLYIATHAASTAHTPKRASAAIKHTRTDDRPKMDRTRAAYDAAWKTWNARSDGSDPASARATYGADLTALLAATDAWDSVAAVHIAGRARGGVTR
jgi:hypothetical protein